MSKEEIIQGYIKKLNISREDAEALYKCDYEGDSNEAQDLLTAQTENTRHNASASSIVSNGGRKPRVPKKIAEKSAVFEVVKDSLKEKFGENVEIVTEDKLILVHLNEKVIKIDLVDHTKTYKK